MPLKKVLAAAVAMLVSGPGPFALSAAAGQNVRAVGMGVGVGAIVAPMIPAGALGKGSFPKTARGVPSLPEGIDRVQLQTSAAAGLPAGVIPAVLAAPQAAPLVEAAVHAASARLERNPALAAISQKREPGMEGALSAALDAFFERSGRNPVEAGDVRGVESSAGSERESSTYGHRQPRLSRSGDKPKDKAGSRLDRSSRLSARLAGALAVAAGFLAVPGIAFAGDGGASVVNVGVGGVIGAIIGFVVGATIGWQTSNKGRHSGDFNFGLLFDVAKAIFFGLIGAVVLGITGSMIGASR